MVLPKKEACFEAQITFSEIEHIARRCANCRHLLWNYVFLELDYMVSFSPGWNFSPATGLKYCFDYVLNFNRAQNANFHEKVYLGAKTQSMRMLAFLFRPGLKKNDSNDMDFWARLTSLKILARFQKPGQDFQPGLKPSICNRHLHFKKISFRTRAGISGQLTGLKLTM